MPPGSPSRPHRPRRRMDDDTVESLTEMLHLRDYWRTVQKRIWTLITAFCLIVGSVTVVTLLMTPVYESTASIQIDAQPQAYANFQSIGQYGSGQYLSDQEYFNTQHRKLRSRVQAQAVIDELHLLERPEFSDLDDPVMALLEMITIEPVPKTRLVWVYVRINNAELAQEINQAWVEIFVRRNMDELNQGVKQAIFFLKDAQDNSLKELTDAERELYDFRRKNNLIAGSSDDKDNLYQQHLAQLNEQRSAVDAERATRKAEYEAGLEAIRGQKDIVKLSMLVQSELMGTLRDQYSLLRSEREGLATRYLPGYYRMQELDRKLVETEEQIRAEVNADLSLRKYQWDQAEAKFRSLSTQSSELTTATLAVDVKAEDEFNRLYRKKQARENLYLQLLDKMQDLNVASSIKENNIRIIDSAEAKQKPVEPNYVRNIFVAVLAGGLVGVSLALFFDYMDTTIKTREEVEALGIPFLGIVPSVPGLSGEGWDAARERYLYSLNYPKSAFAEFCRNIRTNINFLAREDGKPPTRILITSAGPREGKTTSSINLGIAFAAAGRRVCLVDADLRRPSLHHAFGPDNSVGFSSLIQGTATVDEVAQVTPQPGLLVVPSGPRPPNPAEMLGSPACIAALDKLNQHFDLVIIDSPPVVAVTDAVVLSAHVEGVVMVVKSFKVAKDLVMQAKRQLTDVEARLIGVILNDFDIQRKTYGYYYYYTYYGAEREDVGRKRSTPSNEV